jgi:LAS superfamily LD-carboxypeptidase LdcB
MFNAFEITGRARTHVVQNDEPRFAAHRDVVAAFLDMRKAAAADGIELHPFSTFRDYSTQLRIWNNKFAGKKPLYDSDGVVRPWVERTDDELIDLILNWSALPGASRHQWGTEIDVVDGRAIANGYVPHLLPQETCEGGIFFELHQWLDRNIQRFGFFRPYKEFRGGMYAEPWHLSFAPLSTKVIALVSVEVLTQATVEAEILGKQAILRRLPEIIERHVVNIVGPDEQ